MVEKLMGLLNIGEEYVLWFLIIVSVVCIGIIIERLVLVFRTRASVGEMKGKLMGYLADGNIDGAKKYFGALPSPVAKVIAAALSAMDRSPEAMQENIEAELVEQRIRLERGLDTLGTTGANAPFIGLFGTVLGIIDAFHAMANSKTAEPQIIMSGISMSLVATAIGLAVAIPALVAFNYLKAYSRDLLRHAEALCKPIMGHSLDLTLGGHAEKAGKGEAKKAEV